MNADCNNVQLALRAGTLDEEQSAHLDGCPDCAGMAAAAKVLSAAEPPPALDLESALAAVEAEQAGERGLRAWLRSRSSRGRRALLIGVSAAIVLAQIAVLRADLEVHPAGRMTLSLLAFAVLAVVALWTALRPLHQPALRPGVAAGLVLAALAGPAALAALPAAHLAHPASTGGVGAELWPRAAACFGYGSALVVPLLLLAWALGRGGAGLRAVAFLVAAGAGAVANALLQVHCPLTEPAHLLLGHATIGPALAALALALLLLARDVGWARR
jgi:hypothetical protein